MATSKKKPTPKAAKAPRPEPVSFLVTRRITDLAKEFAEQSRLSTHHGRNAMRVASILRREGYNEFGLPMQVGK